MVGRAGALARICVAAAMVTLLALAPEADAQRAGASRPARARASATKLGFAVDRLARIDSALERAVARGEIVGAVALVMRDGEIAYERAVGWADRDSGRRMTTNAIFRIASQSKALTSVAIMMLAEEGKLALGDQVG